MLIERMAGYVLHDEVSRDAFALTLYLNDVRVIDLAAVLASDENGILGSWDMWGGNT